jgi:hypothetical protein
MPAYHQRRPVQNLEDAGDQLAIIRRNTHLTLAMSRADEPYLCTVNYAYDEAARAFFFHCAPKGKKVAIMRSNPVVWGQILEDLGYRDGHCLHGYRTVQFRGRVTFVDDLEERRRALHLMIDQLESRPEASKARFVTRRSVRSVAIGRVYVERFSAKVGKEP